jgi:SAM-dependent methyltransferase
MSLFGSELFSEGLSYAAKRTQKATFFQMDARNIPFKDEFDIIGAFDVIEHIPEDEIVLSQMFQAVRPNGGIVLTVPQHQFLWSKADNCACHVRRYDAKDLKKKVLNAGFRILRTTSFVSLLLPFMMASRLIKGKDEDSYDPLSELKLSRPVDIFFEKCLNLERLFIQQGFDLCMGGSLLLVAQKL